MLRYLVVENIALIQHLDLEFNTGLTMLTGETGAGKSIIIDALSLVLGARADTTLIRSGTTRATVQATFYLPTNHPTLAWIREKSLDQHDDQPLDEINQPPDKINQPREKPIFLRRILSTNGRSRAFINETQVPVATMSELGAQLVEIHGQQDHHTLLNPATHLAILDRFANHPEELEKVKERFERCRTIATQQRELKQRQTDAAERRAFLQFQLNELETMDIKPGELVELEKQHSRLTHTTQLAQAAQTALDLILESANPASNQVGKAASDLETVTTLDPSLEPISTTVRSLQYELDDVGERIRHYLDELEMDPAQLESLAERINLIRSMMRKYRRDADQLPELVQQWQHEITLMDSADEQEQQLEQAYAIAKTSYIKAAQQLGKSRQAAITILNQTMENQLQTLHMVNAKFSATLLQRGKEEPHASGMEEAVFQVSPNPGEPLKPLHLIASGGELSRITLALKTAISHSLPVPTQVFDEIDVGVGGRVAASIGAKMAHISQQRQVLAVTHLPQVAAWGKEHMNVTKTSSHGKTVVTITPLTTAMRTEELARMLAGDTITAPARKHAQELLASSAKLTETKHRTKPNINGIKQP